MMSPNERLLSSAKANSLPLALNAIADGADPIAADKNGTTAAMWFANFNNTAAVLVIGQIQSKALKGENGLGMSVLRFFAANGNYAGVIACYDLCPSILEETDRYGFNVAMQLALEGNIDGILAVAAVAPFLLQHQNAEGVSVIALLARNEHYEGIDRITKAVSGTQWVSPYKYLLKYKTLQPQAMMHMLANLMHLGYPQPSNLEALAKAYGIDYGALIHEVMSLGANS